MSSTENYKQPAYSKAVQAARTLRDDGINLDTVSTSISARLVAHVEISLSPVEMDVLTDILSTNMHLFSDTQRNVAEGFIRARDSVR